MTDPFPASDHASHDTILVASLADHSLPAVSEPPPRRSSPRAASAPTPGRPPRTPCRDQGDAHAPRPTRLHADRARRGAPPFRRLASLRGDPRDVARRAQPATRGRAHDAGPRRSARLRGSVLLMGSASSAAPTTIGAPAGGAAAGTATGTSLGAAAIAAASAAAAAPPAAPALGDTPGRRSSAAPLPPRAAIATAPRSHRAPRASPTARRRPGGLDRQATRRAPTPRATSSARRTSAASRLSRSCRSRSWSPGSRCSRCAGRRAASAADSPVPRSPRGTRLHLIRAQRTPDVARWQRADLPRIFRAPAPDDVEGRARQRRLRLLQHRPARHPGPPARLRRRRLRPPGADLPPRAVRRVQGHPPAHAGRPARPVPQGPRGGQGAPHPRLRAAGVRGGRRDRHAHASTRRSAASTRRS